MNKIILSNVGLVSDVVLVKGSALKFTVAWTRKSATDDQQKEDFFNCITFPTEKQSIYLQKLLKKGNRLEFSGQMELNRHVKEGQVTVQPQVKVDANTIEIVSWIKKETIG